MQTNTSIGIDVSKLTLDACAVLGEKTKKKSFQNTESGFKELVSWTSELNLKDLHFCMESTGCYSEEIAEFLYNSDYKVSVVNPLLIKAFRASKMVRQKTDSSDSEIIAKFCLQNNPSLWQPASRENKELHEINARIDSLKSELNRLINFLEKKYLNQLVQESIHEEMDFIRKSIKTLEVETKKIIENKETLKKQYDLLVDITGVGTKLALTIIADMPDVSRFENAKQYAAFVGVTPSHFQSGTSVNGRSRISRIGSKKIRKTLYMNALVVKNHNEHFKRFVEKLYKKGKSAKVILVAIMRKLMHIIYGMLKHNQKFDPKLAFSS